MTAEVGYAFDSAFLPYTKTLTALARENRSNPTKAETKIWREILRMTQFAQYKFLRQKPIGGYIVDFYCSELRVVTEIDGGSHAGTISHQIALEKSAQEYDSYREAQRKIQREENLTELEHDIVQLHPGRKTNITLDT